MSAVRETTRLGAWLGSLDPIQRTLCGLGILLVLGSLVILLSWHRTPEATATVPLPPEPPVLVEEPGPETPFAYDMIVERNPFAPSRRPPAQPWGLTLVAPAPDKAEVAAAAPPPVTYRLYGTVLRGPGERSFALIDADPQTPGPERYEIGDRVGSHRLLRIEATRAVLSGGLRLDLRDPDAIGTGGPP